MSTSQNKVAPKRKIRPARKQVAVDQIDKTEQVQTGKEYSASTFTGMWSSLIKKLCSIWFALRHLVQQVGRRRP